MVWHRLGDEQIAHDCYDRAHGHMTSSKLESDEVEIQRRVREALSIVGERED